MSVLRISNEEQYTYATGPSAAGDQEKRVCRYCWPFMEARLHLPDLPRPYSQNIRQGGSLESAIMNTSHEEHPMSASAGLCDGAVESAVAAAERVSGGGEPHPQSSPAESVALVGRGEVYAR